MILKRNDSINKASWCDLVVFIRVYASCWFPILGFASAQFSCLW